MHRQELLGLLARHETRFMEEAAYVERARAFVGEHGDCFYRELWPAHVTGSVWVVNPARDKALLLHHRKLDQWFQPGGHADGDADILRVSLRETAEETGRRYRDTRQRRVAPGDLGAAVAGGPLQPQPFHPPHGGEDP
jgi:hypothetical protein